MVLLWSDWNKIIKVFTFLIISLSFKINDFRDRWLGLFLIFSFVNSLQTSWHILRPVDHFPQILLRLEFILIFLCRFLFYFGFEYFCLFVCLHTFYCVLLCLQYFLFVCPFWKLVSFDILLILYFIRVVREIDFISF